MQLLEKTKFQYQLFPLFVLTTLVINAIALLMLMFHGKLLDQVKNKNNPTLVQLEDGRAIAVTATDHQERTSKTIRRFVGESLTFTLTWSESIPLENIWNASQTFINPDFHPSFRQTTEKTILGKSFQGNLKGINTALVVQSISQPEQIAPGKWKVKVLANLLVFKNSDTQGQVIPWNQIVVVRALDNTPEIDEKSSLKLALDRLIDTKLQIAKICEIEAQTCN